MSNSYVYFCLPRYHIYCIHIIYHGLYIHNDQESPNSNPWSYSVKELCDSTSLEKEDCTSEAAAIMIFILAEETKARVGSVTFNSEVEMMFVDRAKIEE